LIENIPFPSQNTATRHTDEKFKEGLSQLSSFMAYFSL
jgi:hypothetical protein